VLEFFIFLGRCREKKKEQLEFKRVTSPYDSQIMVLIAKFIY